MSAWRTSAAHLDRENVRIGIARRHPPPPAVTWNSLGGRSRNNRGKSQENRLSQGNPHDPPYFGSIHLFSVAVCTVNNINRRRAQVPEASFKGAPTGSQPACQPALQSPKRRRNIFSAQFPAARNQRQTVAIGQRHERSRIEFPIVSFVGPSNFMNPIEKFLLFIALPTVLLLDWYRFATDRRTLVGILALREVKETSMLPIEMAIVGEIPHQLEYLSLHLLKTRVTLFALAIFLIGIWPLAFYASRMLRNAIQRLLGKQQFSTVSFLRTLQVDVPCNWQT